MYKSYESLIEFVLGNEENLKQAIVITRLDSGHGGRTGGNGSGHSSISDPTAIQGIKRASELPVVIVEYGLRVLKDRPIRAIKKPERWLLVCADVRRFCKHKGYTDFYDSRYKNKEDYKSFCRKNECSRTVYYAKKQEIIHFAELCAVARGIFLPYEEGSSDKK